MRIDPDDLQKQFDSLSSSFSPSRCRNKWQILLLWLYLPARRTRTFCSVKLKNNTIEKLLLHKCNATGKGKYLFILVFSIFLPIKITQRGEKFRGNLLIVIEGLHMIHSPRCRESNWNSVGVRREKFRILNEQGKLLRNFIKLISIDIWFDHLAANKKWKLIK
jgi:hypothetical protein